MTVTKKELAMRVAADLGVKKQFAYRAVESLFYAMRDSLTRATESRSGDSASWG